MATDKEVAKLKRYITRLKEYLRDQLVWEQEVRQHLRQLHRQRALGPPPTVTDPPRPPR